MSTKDSGGRSVRGASPTRLDCMASLASETGSACKAYGDVCYIERRSKREPRATVRRCMCRFALAAWGANRLPSAALAVYLQVLRLGVVHAIEEVRAALCEVSADFNLICSTRCRSYYFDDGFHIVPGIADRCRTCVFDLSYLKKKRMEAFHGLDSPQSARRLGVLPHCVAHWQSVLKEHDRAGMS